MLLDGLTFENVENLALSISPRARSGKIEISLKPAYQQGEETIVPADHFDWVLIASVNKECEDPERVFGADDTRPWRRQPYCKSRKLVCHQKFSGLVEFVLLCENW